ncbi:Sigma 54 modulation protein/ribosomal protein S30EA [Roseobacter sp. AzwK-3b]|uniref:HPF/RaiA family ribosome-associated protein n=1 Tax=Roseobacter sp. AzwK-3b TaxID=351016 RepID=UPI0001568D83|nr:HPF/RaiA family ribosome-associated protein [Roseobacter sp. AzwK-3b]EDM70729.1 Sigma 54 modulation protein/ribosomal protein S30EA [Roseobacter sp. AzwK-3b]
MQTPLELTFRHMDQDDALRALIETRVTQLDALFDGITSCHVTLQPGHNRHRQGNLYEVTIELRVPGTELVVHPTKGDVPAHEHPQVAIRDAFTAIERQLRAHKQRISGEVKQHEGMLQGRIAQIDHAADFGQIATTDNRLIYFHRNAVVDGDFDALSLRDPVELVVNIRDSAIGPQASTVRPIGAQEYEP